MDILITLVGFFGGMTVGWAIAQRLASTEKDILRNRANDFAQKLAAEEARTEERSHSIAREQKFFDKAIEEMQDKFKGLAQNALVANNKQFLQNTEVKIKPLSDALKQLEVKTGELEQKRDTAYGEISQQIKAMMEAAGGMTRSSEQMQSLLKGSNQVRGNWGELLLRNVIEFAGMEEHVHFDEQITITDGQRPDMIIKLPGGAGIPVDSKCPFTAFQRAKNEEDSSKAKQLLEEHAKAVRKHVTDLGRKDYSATIDGNIDFTVMFLPGDHLLEAALAIEPTLQDDALRKRILITNPVSLVALLRTVRIYWRQDETDRNAEQIAVAARELYDRCFTWMEHFSKVGKGLSSAVDSYNRVVGSWQRNVSPAGRRLQALKIDGQVTRSLEDTKSSPTEIPLELRELNK